MGSVIGLVGMLVVIISSLGIVGNYEDWGFFSCSSPQPYPVCGSIFWFIVELGLVALVGVSMVVVGLHIASKEEKNPQTPQPS